jgi:hypothetical protein
MRGDEKMSNVVRVFRCNCNIDDLRFGRMMNFHPVAGVSLDTLRHYARDDTWKLLQDEWLPEKTYPPIGDGKSHRAGEPYLLHWLFDPFTGDPLSSQGHSSKKSKGPYPEEWILRWRKKFGR